jgi:UDP:flavonoid glycosyltransferase YjiC (YdhE family)
MRVLFSSFDAVGHIFPMIPLARAFQDRGDEVRWVCGAGGRGPVEKAGIPAVEGALSADDRRARVDQLRDEAPGLVGEQLTAFVAPRVFGRMCPEAILPGLLELAQRWKPDVMVHDAGEYAAPIASAATGIPHVTHSYGALHAKQMVEAITDEAVPVWQRLGLEPRRYGGMYDHLYVDIYPPSLQTAAMEHVPRRQFERPATYEEKPEEDIDPLAKMTPSRAPLVYLTLGTERFNHRLLAACLAGLGRLDVRVIVTTGRHDPAAFGVQPPTIVIERYIPKSLFLSQCAVVVSHGGSGTMLAAYRHGIPQLCIPLLADAFLNAAPLVRSGAGLAINEQEAEEETVGEAIRKLLDEESFRVAAQRIAYEINGMPSPDEVAVVVESVALGIHS